MRATEVYSWLLRAPALVNRPSASSDGARWARRVFHSCAGSRGTIPRRPSSMRSTPGTAVDRRQGEARPSVQVRGAKLQELQPAGREVRTEAVVAGVHGVGDGGSTSRRAARRLGSAETMALMGRAPPPASSMKDSRWRPRSRGGHELQFQDTHAACRLRGGGGWRWALAGWGGRTGAAEVIGCPGRLVKPGLAALRDETRAGRWAVQSGAAKRRPHP